MSSARTRGDADVVVVGGGPSGLLAAGVLAAAGLRTLVLEVTRTPHPGVRASTLHARAMELLDEHGVPGIASLPRSPRGHYVGLPLDLSAAPSPWAGAWRCPQAELVRRLDAWARARGVRVARGERVTTVVQDADRVTVGTVRGPTFVADAVVGADGASSTVRRAVGAACLGPAPGRSIVRADVRVADGILRPRRFERIGDLTVTCAPLDASTTRIMLHDPGWEVGRDVDEHLLRTTWTSATAEELPPQLDWIDTFADTTSWIDRVVVGRTALCGDAAHQFVPIGGVALNSALVGAAALARRLADLLRGGRAEDLSEYAARATARARRTAHRLQQEARLLFGVDARTLAERAHIAARLRDDAGFRARVVRQVAGLGDPGRPLLPVVG